MNGRARTLRHVARSASLLLLCGCGGLRYQVQPVDSSYGIQGNMMLGNRLGGRTPREGIVELNVAYAGKDTMLTMLYVRYAEGPWLLIAPGESLVFSIDGERVAVRGHGSGGQGGRRGIAGSQMVYETAIYQVHPSLLARLAGARDVRVTVNGENRHVDRDLTPENRSRIRDFLARYVPASAVASPAAAQEPARTDTLQDLPGWVTLGQQEDVEMQIQAGRVTRESPGVLRVWERWLYRKPMRTAAGRRYDYGLTRALYDCTARRMKPGPMELYAQDGSFVLEMGVPELRGEWKDVAPGTVGEVALNGVCKTFRDLL